MNEAGVKRNSVQVDLQDGESVQRLTVHQAWLPMTIWEKVRVRIKSSRGLTLIERFVIECLLKLRTCSAEDLLAIASLTPEMSNWLFGYLEQRGLAQRKENNIFIPVQDVCIAALESDSMPIEHEEDRAFLWFPETEEFVVLQDTADLVRKLRKMNSIGKYPLPKKWLKEKQSQILNDALDAKSVYGQGADLISNVLDGNPFEKTCPAYYCRALLPDPSSKNWNLEITGILKKKRSFNANDSDTSSHEREFTTETINLPILPHLVESWSSRLKKANEEICFRLTEKGLKEIVFNNNSYRAAIDNETAKTMAKQNMLSEFWNLAVQLDWQIAYGIPFELYPDSPDTQVLFDLDTSVRQLLAAPKATDAIESICAQSNIAQENILDRLWKLKLFAKVYELREREDFTG